MATQVTHGATSRRRSTTAWSSSATERDELTREATLESLDVDSLDLVELAQIVEDEFGVELRRRRRQGRQDGRRGDRPGGGEGRR